MDFHRFYFDRGGVRGGYNLTICAPHVRLLGDVAVVSYVRLLQVLDDAGKPGHIALGRDPRLAASAGGLAARAFSSLQPRLRIGKRLFRRGQSHFRRTKIGTVPA